MDHENDRRAKDRDPREGEETRVRHQVPRPLRQVVLDPLEGDSKQREVADKLKNADHFGELNSLSLARNALTHNAGVVRSPFDCNNDARDALIIQWLAFDMLVTRNGEERVVDHAPFDTHTLPGDGPVQIGLRFTPRELVVPAGHQIKLTHPQVAELCMFYRILCDKAIDAYRAFLSEKGILRPEPDEADASQEAP